ncbi:DUF445 domain-containing protein [Staphylococcus kloosii]|uniref:DUF445 domain-containing protein n=1 Tax=Staphylococcus kloosii TaxID=29384 RepID=UPI001E414A63|nr:DUF445 family protein [Staphylococcus kloosii]MCD8879004.1 DUF445 family protein [Staphylococcus kloosii]
MHALLIILFMIVIGALIGGVTNIIAVKMLFHPFKTYYIFGKRVPFTPGLIPKRREEIASKIGQVIEDHLLTEEVIYAKLNAPTSRVAIEELLKNQIQKLKNDNITIQDILTKLDIKDTQLINDKATDLISTKLSQYYQSNYNEKLTDLLPTEVEQLLDDKVAHLHELLFERAYIYLNSEKGTQDISSMLETFFNEKGKIVGMLQMFMSKESIVDRIQSELIRLTSHPKANAIASKIINNEYQNLKQQHLNEVLDDEKFAGMQQSVATLIANYLNIDKQVNTPIHQLMPDFINYLEDSVSVKLTNVIIDNICHHITPIMQKINLSGMVEQQINTFDLDYIERLIIDIANKELKLIMLLGFILGGIIGALQGVIAIFV